MYWAFSRNFDQLIGRRCIGTTLDSDGPLEAINATSPAGNHFATIFAVPSRPLAMPDAHCKAA